jgi:hypothetical protein
MIDALNRRMDQPRVMHGPQDLCKSFSCACTAFLPNGTVWESAMERAVRDFYGSVRWPTVTGYSRVKLITETENLSLESVIHN